MRTLAAIFALVTFLATLCAGGCAAWLVWFDGGVLAVLGALLSMGAASAAAAWAEYLAEIAP